MLHQCKTYLLLIQLLRLQVRKVQLFEVAVVFVIHATGTPLRAGPFETSVKRQLNIT